MGAETLFRRDLLPAGSTVLCAVSGGADSVCLLHLCRELPGVRVLCAHYEHGIRGEASRADAAFVEKLCAAWEIPCYVGHGDVPAYAKERHLSLETAARELRYAFLRQTAEEAGADLIATAHTQNDNAETLLFRLARGTGLRGLCGIPPERDGLIRPLLGVSREEIETYLRERNIPWVEDESNREDDAARNRARHHLLPLLESLHPGAAANIARCAENLREDEECLSALASEKLACWGERLPISELLNLPRAISARVLRQWLGAELPRERVEALLALCSAPSSVWAEAAGVRVRREFDALVIDKGELPPLAPRSLPLGERVEMPELGLAVRAEKCPAGAEIQSSFTIFSFSCDIICDTLSLTRRREGDRLALRGREGTKALKKWLMEAHVPATERDRVPVVRHQGAILAVYGLGQAEGTLPALGEPFIRVCFEKL